MKIAFHLGVHCTDDEKLVSTLLANAARLAREGIVVPNPESYRALLRDTLTSTRGSGVSHETEETLLDAVMDRDQAERVVFSNASFLAMRQRALHEGQLYPTAGQKCQWMAALFPSHSVEFHLGIRNPATFLPALFQGEKAQDFAAFLGGADPLRLSWADLVRGIREAVPAAPITVWCDEDTPLIWPEVLRAVAGHARATRLDRVDDFLVPLMTPDGMKRMLSYLDSHPPQTEAQRRRIVAAFLDKYALEAEMEMELDLPGWDEAYVDRLTQHYEQDVLRIARVPGVTLITT